MNVNAKSIVPTKDTVSFEPINFEELPDASKLGKQEGRARELLTELDAITQYEQRCKEIKEELQLIQSQSKVKGIRSGDLCFVSRMMPGRKSLDKGLLIENGVKLALIKKCIKQGEPFLERRFKNLGKGRGAAKDD